jgi:cytoplasmic tRNA 2-thiolation protein 1
MKICKICNKTKASIKLPKTNTLSCISCFTEDFETIIHKTIISNNLFPTTKTSINEKIAIGISGGKDSTVLAYVINKLKNKYNYNIEIHLIAIDEGIKGYRDESIETIIFNSKKLNLPLTIASFKELFGYTMDEIVPYCGIQNSCTYCGVFRRVALEKECKKLGIKKLLTGHNADDIAETVLMNILRGDFNRLPFSVKIITDGEINRIKPFKYIYEKEIVMYAHYMNLKYFVTECSYAVGAFRGYCRELIKKIESDRTTSIIDIIHSGENFDIDDKVIGREKNICEKCGGNSSNKLCKCCKLIENLNVWSNKKNKINIKYEN